MNEPPSDELVRQLTELQLCHPSDLRRAGGRVRRLAYDLPSFDSVWIDSLVQLRMLTPYQAKQLEQGAAGKLRIGSFVAIDELGHQPFVTTYLAQRLNRRDRCILKCMKVQPDQMATVVNQMERLLEKAKGFAHPQLVLPNEFFQTSETEIVTVARFVPGLPLNDLLVRRGRFPAPIVFEIGRQLLDGLAALQSQSLVHGDIRMSNVRLADHGLAVLVDGAIRPVIHPEITIHDKLPLEAYDGMAPELIGTGAPPTASSELYAVGCLLWQLLAGRPPYTTADPLAKLASHQTKTIDDVRTWAPDTPALLADTIRQMTSPDPNERPRSFEEVLKRWRRPSSFGRSRLKQFRRLFDGGVPHFVGPVRSTKVGGTLWVVTLLCVAAGATAMMFDNGMRNVLLEIAQDVRSISQKKGQVASEHIQVIAAETKPLNRAISEHGLMPLPQPDGDGLILLDTDGPYEAGRLNVNGELTIRGEVGSKPVIQVDDLPLSIKAKSVTLERLSIQRVSDSDPATLVMVRSQRLRVTNCEFLATDFDSDSSTAPQPGRLVGSLFWAANDSGLKTESVEITNTAFYGANEAILFAQIPSSLRISNSLKTGAGAFLTFGPKCQPSDANLVLERVTLRESGPLLRMSGILAEKPGATPVRIEALNSVFRLADVKSGLIVAETEHPRNDLNRSVELQATDSVVMPETNLMAVSDGSHSSTEEIDVDDRFQGLMANGIEFAGTHVYPARDSKTVRLAGARIEAAEMPGINPSQIGQGK